MLSHDELKLTYLNLQNAWPGKWLGLPLIYQQCIYQLGWDHSLISASSDINSLYACSKDLSCFIEKNGSAQFEKNLEPAYHSRLHIADTIVGLTALLLAQRSFDYLDEQKQLHLEMTAMVAMLGHDLLHDGSVNQFPEELERQSIRFLRPFLNQHAVAKRDIKTIDQLILMTDPMSVLDHHQHVKQSFFDVRNVACLGLLLQEADILASCVTGVAKVRTMLLAKEWRLQYPTRSSHLLTPEGRLNFLTSFAQFSSPASQLIGIPAMVQKEIKSLQDKVC
jgi:hypothetical protein